MATQVMWGKLKFLVSGKVTRGVRDFNASIEAKADDSKSVKKYTELEQVSFTVNTSAITGGNPIKDYNFLKTWINFNKKGYQLKINQGTGSSMTAWKGGKFRLKSVSLTNTNMDAYGRILAADIQLTFEEMNNKATKKKGTKKKVKKIRKNQKLKGTW